MAKIFVPKTCRVGFQEREGTFTNKLAYVIYYDAKGKLRKEQSWETWRHKPGKGKRHGNSGDPPKVDVTPYDFENTPTSGFVLNKGHTRYAWSHFGERRTVIRIYDPRGVEFEISPENLVGLLMHTDCSHREIQGELVYAWCGTELMLLPASSEEYKAAMNYSELQGTRVGAKDLKEGFTYVTKDEEHLVYLGRHTWFELKGGYGYTGKRVGKKFHIFCDLEGKDFKPVKSVPNTISKQVSDSCHDEYANWVDAYLASDRASTIVGWETRSLTDEDWNIDWDTARYPNDRIYAVMGEDNGSFVTVEITRHHETGSYDWQTKKYIPDYKGPPRLSYRRMTVIRADGSREYPDRHYNSAQYSSLFVTDKSKFFSLYAVFANGLKQKWSGR